MEDIIRELYYGDITLGEMLIKTKEFNAKRKKIVTAEEKLLEKFPEIRDAIEDYLFERAGMDTVSEYQQFLLGFRTGAQLMLEMLKPLE